MADSQVHLWPQDSHPHTFAAALGCGQHMTGLLSRELMPTNQLFILPAGSRVHPRQDLAFLTCFVGDTGQLSSGPSARDGLSTNLSDNVRSLPTLCQTLPISSSSWWNQETTTRPLLFDMCPAIRVTLLKAACRQSHQMNCARSQSSIMQEPYLAPPHPPRPDLPS